MIVPTVLAIGESMIELRQSGDHELRWTFAGDALNCAAAFAGANPAANVQHLTGLGDDNQSTELEHFCASLGVDPSPSVVVPGRSLGLYWITTEDGDRRFTYWRNDSAARHLFQMGTRFFTDPRPDLIIVSGITLAIAGRSAPQLLDQIEQAKGAGARVAYDTNDRPTLCPDRDVTRAHTARALALADIVHASVDDIEALWGHGGTDLDDWPQLFDIAELLVSDGDGTIRVLADARELRHQPPVVPVVDTAGAGDALFGTYLGHRLAGLPVEDAITRALQVSATVVQSAGALTHLVDPS